MDKLQFVAELAKLRPASTFLTLHGYKNENGEVADHNIIFHISYKSALQRSILALSSYIPNSDFHAIAKEELLSSFKKSLDKIETIPVDEISDGYSRFFDNDGKYIRGVKLHEATNTLHLYGLALNKHILVPGEYKKINHRPLTLAKNELKTKCAVSHFRQFILSPTSVDRISVERLSLIPPN